MTEQEKIELKEYLYKNLSVKVNVSRGSSFMMKSTKIIVSLYLEDELISENEDCIYGD